MRPPVKPPSTRRPKKADLPTKICATCGRPFSWRKKWDKVWDEVRYCSERCRRDRVPASSGLPKV